ncbi:hypothetical protein P4679_22845 [Priestia megaterium]|uniref:hypothetical protein n=1 Tax=Priestia megaterium TaxID=1404 RepID=UPI002E1BB93A|nr:hypothetical protein [Priestia megaterium]
MKKVMLIVLSSIFVLSTNIQVAQAYSSGSRGGYSSSSRSSYSSRSSSSSGSSYKSSYSSSSSSSKPSTSSSSSPQRSGSSYKSGVKSYKPSTSDTTKKTTTDKQTSNPEAKKDTGKFSLTKPDTKTQNKKETTETKKDSTNSRNNAITNQNNINSTNNLSKDSSDYDYKRKHRYTGPVPNKSKFLYTALGAYLIYKFTQPNGQPVYANVENGKEVEMDDVKDYKEVSSIPEDAKVNSDLKKDVNELKTENQQQIAADKANEKSLKEEAEKKDRTGLYAIFGLIVATLAGILFINRRKEKVR